MTFRNLLNRRWGRKRGLPVRYREEDPFTLLHQEMNRLFDTFERGWGLSLFEPWGERQGVYSPSVNVSEDDHEFLITAELPGLDEKDVEVILEKDLLTIQGEKKEEKEESGKDYYHMERSYGTFRRSIPLPDEVDADKIEASFKKGILSIHLPKTEAARKETRKISIKAA